VQSVALWISDKQMPSDRSAADSRPYRTAIATTISSAPGQAVLEADSHAKFADAEESPRLEGLEQAGLTIA